MSRPTVLGLIALVSDQPYLPYYTSPNIGSHVGTDNTNDKCTIGVVPNIFAGNLGHHSGPFDGITIGCTASLAKAGLAILPSDFPPDVPLSAMFPNTPAASA